MAGPLQIDRTPPRAVFAQLVASALGEARLEPSPMASAYLVELLLERVREPAADPAAPDEDRAPTLAEALLGARQRRGADRVRRLRRLGDRALFVSGYFGDSLNRSVVDLDYYREIGRSAYGDAGATLAVSAGDRSWPGLFFELARGFGAFVDVLAAIGDRTRADRPADLLRLHERYLRTGSDRDRRRLVRLGYTPPPRGHRRWQ